MPKHDPGRPAAGCSVQSFSLCVELIINYLINGMIYSYLISHTKTKSCHHNDYQACGAE